MMTKKVVGLLTAAMLVFGFAMSAQCASEWPSSDETGSYPYQTKAVGKTEIPNNLYELSEMPCDARPADHVMCPGPDTQDKDKCTAPFDYDGDFAGGSIFPNDFGSYCPVDAGKGTETRNRRILMDICDCPNNCDLNVGTQIGIQMTILTPGVYWAKDENSVNDAMGGNTVWFDILDHKATVAQYCSLSFEKRRNFGQIKYYTRMSTQYPNEYNDKGKIQRSPLGAGIDELTQSPGAELGYANCRIPSSDAVQVIESSIATDYVIKQEDVGSGGQGCVFWIDLPKMRVNKYTGDGLVAATTGDAIKVRITLLWDRTYDGICADCNPPNMCETIRTVGIVCCEEVTPDDSGCVFFPYVFQGLDAWQSGIAVSALNRTALPDNAKCTLTVQDTAGNTATYVKTDMGNKLVWAFVLDQIIGNFTGGANLVPGAVSLKIESNYRMDGYSFMMADMEGSYFGAGAMARGCTCSTCP